MSALDAKLLARRQELLGELDRIEHAALPVDAVVTEALAELDRDIAAFKAAPRSVVGMPFGATLAPHMLTRHVLAAHGALLPKETRALVESATRARCEGSRTLRLSAADKDARASLVRAELADLERRIEADHRRVEAADGVVLPRSDVDPAAWLMIDPAVVTTERKPDASANNSSRTAGRI
jgi:hypothetical protein